MTYWLQVFTAKSFSEFQKAGAMVSGFPERRWGVVQQLQPGDIIICYLKGISSWVGALEVLSKAFWDETLIWQDAIYPSRVKVKPIVLLDAHAGITIKDMLTKLQLFCYLADTKSWGAALRMSPRRLAEEDGKLIISQISTTAMRKRHNV